MFLIPLCEPGDVNLLNFGYLIYQNLYNLKYQRSTAPGIPMEGNLQLILNSNFLIQISLQFGCVNLPNFACVFDLTEFIKFEISKVYDTRYSFSFNNFENDPLSYF